MVDGKMVELEATNLLRVVGQVLEDTSPLAQEARFVADEILRLRDTGQLSKQLAGDVKGLIYQRYMHSQHSGDFEVTTPIKELSDTLTPDERDHLPDIQIDPVHVHPRIADIALSVRRTRSQGPR